MVHKEVKAELKVPAFFRCLNNYVTSIQSRGLAESTGRNSRWALLKARLAEYAHEMGSPEACNDQLAGLWIIKSLVKEFQIRSFLHPRFSSHLALGKSLKPLL